MDVVNGPRILSRASQRIPPCGGREQHNGTRRVCQRVLQFSAFFKSPAVAPCGLTRCRAGSGRRVTMLFVHIVFVQITVLLNWSSR